MKSRRCSAHCTVCGSHFSSDSAFDAHRRGPVEERYCCDPIDDARFAAADESGSCDLTGRGPLVGVTVWTLSAHRRSTFPGLRGAA